MIYTAETFSESNDGRQILTRIEEVYVLYRQMPLPTSRPEFEDRAELFQFCSLLKVLLKSRQNSPNKNPKIEVVNSANIQVKS